MVEGSDFVTYIEARLYIDEASKTGITLGLTSIKNLLDELGNPQDELKFIHVAGTNGKGSVLAYISTILEVAGYKTGRYISPTVQSYRERIQVNQTHIGEEAFATQLSRIKKAIDLMLDKGLSHPSVFEIETALGFLYFKEQACDIVVMETGMGGVTDATNVIRQALVSVFTTVGRDHMEFLGDTIADLTRAKAGIIKRDSDVVYGKLPSEAEEIIKAISKQLGCPIQVTDLSNIVVHQPLRQFTQRFSYKGIDDLSIHLLGKHQIENATLAIEAVRSLQRHGFDVSDDQIKEGLAETRWFARMTIVKQSSPVVIVDGAHNQDAVRALAETLADLFPIEKISGVVGVFKDKEVSKMLTEIKPVIRKLHTIALPNEKRTMKADELKNLASNIGIASEAHGSLAEALKVASKEADVVIAFGSLSYLGDVLKHV